MNPMAQPTNIFLLDPAVSPEDIPRVRDAINLAAKVWKAIGRNITTCARPKPVEAWSGRISCQWRGNGAVDAISMVGPPNLLLSDESRHALGAVAGDSLQFLPVQSRRSMKIRGRGTPKTCEQFWLTNPLYNLDCINFEKSPWKPVLFKGVLSPWLEEGNELPRTCIDLRKVPRNIHMFMAKGAGSLIFVTEPLAGIIKKFSHSDFRIVKLSTIGSAMSPALRLAPHALFDPIRATRPAPSLTSHPWIMGLNNISAGKGLTEHQANTLEQSLGTRLPAAVKGFLLACGAIEVNATEIFADPSKGAAGVLKSMQAMLRAVKQKNLWGASWPAKVVPIAEDGRGGYFALDCRSVAAKRGASPVLHFDPETLPFISKTVSARGERVAPSLQAWIQMLSSGRQFPK